MNANEALSLSKESWKPNESKYFASIVGFQNKIESAAKLGKTSCAIGVVPPDYVDFLSYYFESLGYYVILQTISVIEVLIYLNWKNIPSTSKAYWETKREEAAELKEIDRFLSTI